MTGQLSPSQLAWLRNHLRLGDNFVFAEMEASAERVKAEQQKNHKQFDPARAP